jgi:hypothetical protein
MEKGKHVTPTHCDVCIRRVAYDRARDPDTVCTYCWTYLCGHHVTRHLRHKACRPADYICLHCQESFPPQDIAQHLHSAHCVET